ncbi:coiled-coil protein [Legionella birminghamensis]|uniref:Coiled-coil protein n=1 Tax=Legionella birminghamensis TaxID=28083 RepID=A0A378IE78_9GAMM|nr:hypothetical protein [Legionella birminghamensis]KTC72432.1 coiled-coil protein [Legionella birminghamensis]STX30564.1 coiled-coil protein [Legionella birminghamensis]
MVNLVKLSHKTRNYIQQMNKSNQGVDYFPKEFSEEELPLSSILPWLKKNPVTNSDQQFILEQVQAALLKDIYRTLDDEPKAVRKKNKWGQFKFIFLLICGTLYFICEGFDGVSNVLGLFSIPTAVIFSASLCFSIFSILLFYGLNIRDLSKEFGVKMRQVPELTSTYAKQIKRITAIQAKLEEIYEEPGSVESLQDYLALSQALKLKFAELDDVRSALRARWSHPVSKGLKLLVATLQGIIIFSGAFCAGQTLAMFIAGWILSSVSPTFWPVLLVSILVGLSALACYWCSEKSEIENMVGRQLNLDEETFSLICEEETVTKQKIQLEKLEGKLGNKLQKTKKQAKAPEKQGSKIPGLTRSTSFNSFFRDEMSDAALIGEMYQGATAFLRP